MDSAPDAIVVVDDRGEICLVNRQTEALFGYQRSELLGQPLEILIPERFRGSHPQHRSEYFAEPQVRPMGAEVELAAVRKDGTEFPVDISLSPLDIDGRTLVSAAIRDITDRRRAEAKFQGLLEAAPDAIVVVDEAGLIRLVNRQTEALFGYPRADLLGQPLELLIPERFRRSHPHRREGYFEKPQVRPMGAGELAAVRKDGSEFPVDVSLSPLETEEGMLVSAAIRDVTERKEAEQERRLLETRLHQSQRLESLGQLAGGVAHDFNNLLAVILNYSQFVTSELPPDSEAARDVAEITKAAQRAAALTHQLLIFGRREVVHPEVLDVNDSVRDLGRLLSRTIGEHIELRTTLAPELWQVEADPSGVQQVLMNLVVNARDAMPDGGLLSVETENIEIDAELAVVLSGVVPGRYVRMRISDTGDGMEKAVQARAFEPFYTTKPTGAGTGLGLATVYGVVKQAGGEVVLYSEVGSGTTVSVYLPAVAGAVADVAQDSADMAAVTPQSGAGTVLVVEDEDAVREIIRRVLSRHGYEVLTASDGLAALTVAQNHTGPVDLLITDVVMPHMSGKDLAEALLKARPGLPVLFMSGYAQDVMAVGGLPFLGKPFTAEALLEQVADLATRDSVET
jgi:PAS domain S-box-containing protein